MFTLKRRLETSKLCRVRANACTDQTYMHLVAVHTVALFETVNTNKNSMEASRRFCVFAAITAVTVYS